MRGYFSFSDIGTIQGSTMTLQGPDEFKKDNVVRVVPPVADDKGDVQVLEEGDVFDPDRFLDQFEKHQHPVL